MAKTSAEKQRDFKLRHPKKIKEYQRSRSIQKLFKTFGVTEADYIKMFLSQNGVCAICLRPETRKQRGTLKRLTLDHNHETGAIRGLLCHSCNCALGLLQDNAFVIQAASNYLRRYEGEIIVDSKWPQTSRSDIDFGPIPSVSKKMGEVFSDAMNKPNDPEKRYQPLAFNPTDDYCFRVEDDFKGIRGEHISPNDGDGDE